MMILSHKARFAAMAASVAEGFLIATRADSIERRIVANEARIAELTSLAAGILETANKDGERELTADEQKQITAYMDEVEALRNEVQQSHRVLDSMQRMNQSRGRQTDPSDGDSPSRPLARIESQEDGGENGEQPPQPARASRGTSVQTQGLTQPVHRLAATGTFGFRSLGEFAQSVQRAVVNREMDSRLRAASLSTYGSEGVGADGGFAVPPEFRRTVMAMVFDENTLFGMTDNQPTDSNSVTVPVDETTPWGTSGVRVYTRAEAAAMTQSKLNLKDHTTKLNEIYAFVPMTDELLEDAPMLTAHLTNKAGEALNFKLSDYIVNGTGVGQPLGILNSDALVTQAAEASQTAGTIHADNILKMWARMPASVRSRAVWLCNQDAEPQLMSLGAVVKSASGTAVGGMPIYMPPGGISAAPYGTLLGRPVVTTEVCPAVGTVGDIIFAFMGGYFAPYKARGVKSDVSMHLFFDQGVTAFRWTFRVGGQPWLSAPIARKSGSNTLSHFVALAAR